MSALDASFDRRPAEPCGSRASAPRRGSSALLDDEVERWTAVDVDLAAPLIALRDLVLGGWQAVAAGVLPLGVRRRGRRARRPAGRRRRCGARAAAHVRARPRRRHGRLGPPSWAPGDPPAVHRTPRRQPVGAARHAASVRARRSSSATSRSSTPTRSSATRRRTPVVCSTSSASSSASASTSTWSGPRARAAIPVQAARIERYKSGKYTVERPLHLGAALAGRLDELAPPLSDFGVPLGEAFQLRDDLLGVFGDAERDGQARRRRPAGGQADPARRRRRPAAPTPTAAVCSSCSGARDLTDGEVQRLQGFLVEMRRARRGRALDRAARGPGTRRARRARRSPPTRASRSRSSRTFVAWRDR